MDQRAPVPTTIVSGALGVGKTTAILAALRHRPPAERWAVLVNEFGRVGIDGAILQEGELEVREIAGGCVCCTANLPLRLGLAKLVREVRPDRLLVEPTGLAHPASIIDTIRSPGLREGLALRATLTLVDPRRFLSGSQDALFLDQVRAADVLVGNFADQCTQAQLDRFVSEARAGYPPPLVVATTSFGELQPEWLQLDPTPRGPWLVAPSEGPEECGVVWPPSRVFEMDTLQERLQDLARRPGLQRLKGVFRTPRGFLLVQATPDTISFNPIGWRRDSRVSLIASPAPSPEELEGWFTTQVLFEKL
jgi:G3E family GTPase